MFAGFVRRNHGDLATGSGNLIGARLFLLQLGGARKILSLLLAQLPECCFSSGSRTGNASTPQPETKSKSNLERWLHASHRFRLPHFDSRVLPSTCRQRRASPPTPTSSTQPPRAKPKSEFR